MIRLFITLLFAISASAGILFANTYLAYQQTKQSTVEQDRLVMRDIKNQLVLSVIRDQNTGIFMLPYGVSTENGHTLPDFLALPRTNAFGLDYTYCPFSSNTGSYNDTVNLNSESSYAVSIKNDAGTNGRDYVLYSENIVEDNVLGYVISNHKRDNQIDCMDVISSSSLVFDNSFVQVIYKDELSYNTIVDNAFYNIQNDTDFQEGLLKSSNRLNQQSVFLFETDIQNIGSVVYDNKLNDTSKVIFKGNGNKIIDSLAGVDFVFNNMTVVFENVYLTQNISIEVNNSKIYFNNSSVSNLSSNFSNVIFNNSDLTIDSSFLFTHSDIQFSNDVNIYNNSLLLFNSNIKSNNANFFVNNIDTVFNFDYSSSIDLFTSAVVSHNVNEVFRGNGTVNLNLVKTQGSEIVITAKKGARLSINDTTLLSNDFSILDQGVMLLSGVENTFDNGCISSNSRREVELVVEYLDTIEDGITVERSSEVNLDLNDQFKDFLYNCI